MSRNKPQLAAEPAARDVFVARRFSAPPLGGDFIIAFLIGLLVLAADIGGLLSAFLTPVSQAARLLVIAIAATAPLLWPVIHLRRRFRIIVTTRRAATVGVGYGLGLFGMPAMLSILNILFAPSFLLNWGFLVLWSALIAATPLVYMLAWRIARTTVAKIIIQDGTLCPNCAYCLLGVQSMRCPECGSAFTYEDLETTEDAFRARATGQFT